MITNDNTLVPYWPERSGSISYKAIYESPYVVYKIEDTHFGINVQEGMLETLQHLQSEYHVKLICMEGAAGEFLISDMKSVLKRHEIPRLRKELTSKRLTAPEYLAIVSDFPFILFGVEDKEQYYKNGEALRQAHFCFSRTEKIFERFEVYVNKLKENTYNRKLLEFEQMTLAYQNGNITLPHFINNSIFSNVYHLGLSLDGLSNLEIFKRCVEIEKTIDFGKAVSERNRLIEHILAILEAPCIPRPIFERIVRAQLKSGPHGPIEASHLPPAVSVRIYRQFIAKAKNELLTIAQETKRGYLPASEVYTSLIELASLCGLNMLSYPNMLRYTHYILQAISLPRSELMNELQQATELVRESLFTNDSERQVASLWRAITGIKRLCRLEMTPFDSDLFISEFGPMTIKEIITEIGIEKEPFPDTEQWTSAIARIDNGLNSKGCTRLELLEDLTNGDDNLFEKRLSSFDIEVLLVDLALEAAYRFYQLAPLRGRTIAENTLRCMKENNVTEAVLVSGGFLTHQILTVLERESVSHVVIIPRTEKSQITREDYLKNFEESEYSFVMELRKRLEKQEPVDQGYLI